VIAAHSLDLEPLGVAAVERGRGRNEHPRLERLAGVQEDFHLGRLLFLLLVTMQ
jgi:hypothetical protein